MKPIETAQLPLPDSPATVPHMIHDNIPQAIENLSARIIAIRDSL
jgi:hypothetical protein